MPDNMYLTTLEKRFYQRYEQSIFIMKVNYRMSGEFARSGQFAYSSIEHFYRRNFVHCHRLVNLKLEFSLESTFQKKVLKPELRWLETIGESRLQGWKTSFLYWCL